MAWRTLRRHKGFRDAKVKKIIFLGLDGLDPELTERYIAEGKLPNLKKLAVKRAAIIACEPRFRRSRRSPGPRLLRE